MLHLSRLALEVIPHTLPGDLPNGGTPPRDGPGTEPIDQSANPLWART